MTRPTPGQLHALADALDWSPELLRVASSSPPPAPLNGLLPPLPHQASIPLQTGEAITALLAEVEGLRELQVALRDWTEDLLDRLRALSPPVA
jgi:hypothetical protein